MSIASAPVRIVAAVASMCCIVSASAAQPEGASTLTALGISPNPAVYGQMVTLQATVTSSTGTPTGTVDFDDGPSLIVAGVPMQGNLATYIASGFLAGTHNLSAHYSGDAQHSGSTGLNTLTVTSAQSLTVLSLFPNPSEVGHNVTLSATVSGNAGTPTGTVDFSEGPTPIVNGVPLSSGVASYITSSLTTGTHNITAHYTGDGGYAGSTGMNTQTVNNDIIFADGFE